MSEPSESSKTFSLDDPYDLLAKLHSDLQDLLAAPMWSQGLRAYRAMNCFLTLWHMNDWFWAALKKDRQRFAHWKASHPELIERKKLQAWSCEKSPAMRVAQQIATASKHTAVDHDDPGVVAEIQSGMDDLVILVDGVRVPVENIVHEGAIFWRGLLHEFMPEPVFIPNADM